MKEFFLFATAFRPALGPTQPPIKWIPGSLSPGVKPPACEADHLPRYTGEVKGMRGAVLLYASMCSWYGA
jgi:hypothetical protein